MKKEKKERLIIIENQIKMEELENGIKYLFN